MNIELNQKEVGILLSCLQKAKLDGDVRPEFLMNEILIDLHRKLSDFARQQFPESRSFEPFESPLFEDFGKQLEQWPDMRDAIREQAEISGVSEAFRLAIYPYKTALSSTEVEEFMSGTT